MKHDVITFGCRLNAYESEVIRNNLAESGEGDVAVFNTCAVTKEAERQARQAIRKYRREHPDAKIIVTGCAAQISPEKYAALPEVDQVIGNKEKLEKKSYSNPASGFVTETERVRVNDVFAVEEQAGHLITGMEGHTRAFMQVQNGCNHRCTFCIIPYGRGNSRSVPVGEVVKQAEMLVKSGYRELVLTGVDITSYGEDLPGKPKLGAMLKRLLKLVPGVERLRLSSIDVAEIDEDLLDLIAHEPRFMPHLHISVQAGDDMILKRMKRRHSRNQVVEFCDNVRKLRPDVVFGADIIAGFPTESDAMFENTLNLVADAGLMWLHIFPYSERDGTPAANIPQAKQVPIPVRKARASRLRKAGEIQVVEFLNSRIGKTERVIVEKPRLARTEQFALVELARDYVVGEIATVTISGVKGDHLLEKAAAA